MPLRHRDPCACAPALPPSPPPLPSSPALLAQTHKRKPGLLRVALPTNKGNRAIDSYSRRVCHNVVLLPQILALVMDHEVAKAHFNEPVDPLALGIPDYPEVIKVWRRKVQIYIYYMQGRGAGALLAPFQLARRGGRRMGWPGTAHWWGLLPPVRVFVSVMG